MPTNIIQSRKGIEGKLKFKEWREANPKEWRNWKHRAMKVHQSRTKNFSKK